MDLDPEQARKISLEMSAILHKYKLSHGENLLIMSNMVSCALAAIQCSAGADVTPETLQMINDKKNFLLKIHEEQQGKT